MSAKHEQYAATQKFQCFSLAAVNKRRCWPGRVCSQERAMDDRINYITAELLKIADETKTTFGGLSAAQLNWKPAENSWSVGQCFEHLIKTNEHFYPEFEKLAAGTRQNTFWENWSPMTGFWGRFLIKAVTNDAKKVKAPSKSIVPPSDIEANIIDRFASNVAEINEKITGCGNADREKTVVTSPFLSLMTYKLDDAYTVLVEHTKRHFRQAKRVMEADIFPATNN